MVRRGLTWAALVVATALGQATAWGEEDMRTAPKYLQGLRERGYYELADQFLETLRKAPSTPEDFRVTIDYEQGRLLIDEAARTGDLGLKKELLDQARGKLVTFTQKNPNHALASESLVQLARLLVERGHMAMIQEVETEDPKLKAAKLVEARTSFDQARDSYAKADEKLVAAFKVFPPHLPDNDPRKDERDRTHIAMMEAELQKAVVDYEQGQTYPLGSKERDEYLAKGMTQFEEIYKRYRTQLAGLVARMWQAKCYEEKGDIGPALGIYNELLEHQAPQLRGMQRHVAYFKIIAHGKRKEYALAADLANAWLQRYSSPDEVRSREGLGVQLELAKNILAQLPGVSEKEQAQAVNRVVDVLSQVVRYSSPFKGEALTILKKYKPKVAANAENLSRMGYDELDGQADQAIASQEWDKAAEALKLAVRKADPAKDPDKANLARYKLAFVYYMNKRFYEADVLTEHLARRYPRFSMAPKATEIAMASMADAYNTYREIDRTSDLNRLINVAKYAAETWPDKEEGDAARMTLGQVYHGTGQYAKAIEAYQSVRPKASRWVEAQTRVGASYWDQSKILQRKGDAKEADAEATKALDALNVALKARRDAGALPADPDLIGNVCDIADIQLETGKAPAALALLEPTAQAATGGGATGPAFSRLMTALLRAHINAGQIEKAQADMAVLEKQGGGANLAQLYFGLGKLLEAEMKVLKDKGDRAGLAKRQADYLKFLTALANAKSGQTYESLQWAGEQMLKIQNPGEAGKIFKRILETMGKDKAFLAQEGAGNLLLRTRIKYAEALRGQADFTAAEDLVSELLKEFPRSSDPLFEQGMLLENKAETKQGTWKAAFAHWQKLALRLGTSRPRPPEYYDAWYHAAYALAKDNQPTKAKQTLGSVMRLSPKVGGPEMKEKYDALLKNIK
ncbi:Tetratricopeptide repeat-containing protein [Singulisphaera sp. GP187]|uniref:tetratricopeptide repeat protein n=1 Tax=Singulisphaera sp. GP187 TaxID=1882752 RepID=UPI0009271E47|nr:tetratricopeptide repeat protein [Singulisphaera sp. GP187]SIO66718.1 Tetratricopeptide repeat-containing protein [Singulisphaera sp. GP187]